MATCRVDYGFLISYLDGDRDESSFEKDFSGLGAYELYPALYPKLVRNYHRTLFS